MSEHVIIALIIIVTFVLIFYTYIYHCINCDSTIENNEHFFELNGVSFNNTIAGFMPYYGEYPFFNSGCNENVFGDINCYSPPYLY
jgi:hypothetical protein